MDEPQSLDSLFKEKLFRIPDYQRGYAWQKNQLKDFWEDLINLSSDRKHYTGVLTLNEVENKDKTANEYWLVEDYSYKVYHVVDGQQRLTTFVVFLQAFIDSFREREKNDDKTDKEIYVTESLNLEEIANKYLFRVKPSDIHYKTYKFGYTVDNPSYRYLKHKIFKEDGGGSIKDTFYTLNLEIAYQYFLGQFRKLHDDDSNKLQEIYKKLTKNFLFNEYVIKDEFDVFVAFETMNNRGKKLSDLELLKNRLIYLTTLYTDEQIEEDGRTITRNAINDAWKEIYHQLGRNSEQPLDDDEFLKAHWIMYFKSRSRGSEHVKFLLESKFSPQNIYAPQEAEQKVVPEVNPEVSEESLDELDMDDTENNESNIEDISNAPRKFLNPNEIKKYVDSLRDSAEHWFNSYYPYESDKLTVEEKAAIDRLNRINNMGYFRPLIMSIFKNSNKTTPEERVQLMGQIERFIFIVFRLGQVRSNSGEAEFYNAAREYDKGILNLEDIERKLKDSDLLPLFEQSKILRSEDFYNYLDKKFNTRKKKGFYSWPSLMYFLYEYELSLYSPNQDKKVFWDNLLKTSRDKVSIEHIFPQTPTPTWKKAFADIGEEEYGYYGGSIGNLLLLSQSINSALQNDSFDDKKNPKSHDSDGNSRRGYSKGSYSEMEVAKYDKWGPEEIKERGLHLLAFMEERWDFKFESDEAKEKLLFLNIEE